MAASLPEQSQPRAQYRTLRELVQTALLEDILQNKYVPGQRLTEAELAEAYGVSRGPIREAIRALEERGLLRATSNKGVVVSRLTSEEIRQEYEIRAELESLAARLAATRLSDAGLAEMERLLAAMDAAVTDPVRWLALNNHFHFVLYEASGRPRLCNLIRESMGIVEPYARLFLDMPDMLTRTHQDHPLLLEAARKRDGDACAAITRRHLEAAAEDTVVLVRDDRGEGPRDQDGEGVG